MPMNIAIDGPVGAGKSSIADQVAQRLHILHLDTGAMYRTVALYMLRNGIDPQDEQTVSARCGEADVRVAYRDGAQRTMLGGEDVSDLIRTGEVSAAASAISKWPEVRRRMLTFVVVGGGPTGIEESGALTELFGIQQKEFHNLDFSEVSVKLIEATPNVLPMVAPNLREHAVKVLRKKGVDVMLNTQVVGYDGNDLKLKDGTTIPTQTVIWAAGVKAVPFIKDCGGEVDRGGRIIVNEKLQVEGSDCVFAIGDCAHYQHGTERPLPTVAPVAMQQAQTAHDNIMKLIRGQQDLATFHYKDLGAMATIGRGEAVVDKTKLNPQMTGFLAWCAWMFVHLLRLAGAHANFTVAIKWTWNLFSGTRLGRIITNIKD